MRVVIRQVTLAALIGYLASNSFAQDLPPLPEPEPAAVTPVAADGLAPGTRLGFYDASTFAELSSCAACQATPQARFYFKGDYAVAPLKGAAQFDRSRLTFDDLRAWASSRKGVPSGELPSVIWAGSPQVIEGTLAADGKQLTLPSGEVVPFALVPKIRTNLSYFDQTSVKYFAGQKVVARGVLKDGTFVARTLWPASYALTALKPTEPLLAGESAISLVRGGPREERPPFSARVLWQKNPGEALSVAGKPVLAFILNGAQGDDDEAHGGHFAVATGVFGPNGEWNQWLVNNFYNLGSVSEKGIIASTLPMDAYMADLNSGQSWYRPSYVMVAVLKDQRGAQLYQEGISRVFQHFYRQDFPYKHATANCTGLNVETLRTLGWNVPTVGADDTLKAYAALPYMAIKEGSLASGKGAFDYLATERTNLYPLVGFSTLADDLLTRIAGKRVATSGLERQLAEDLEAVIFVQVPQFPSSRAFGFAPVGSMAEYMARVPENKDDWKIVPVDARPFPAELKDKDAPVPERPPSEFAFAAESSVLVALLSWFAASAVLRRLRARKDAQ